MAVTKPNDVDNVVHQIGRNFTWEGLFETDSAAAAATLINLALTGAIDTSKDFSGDESLYWNRVKIRHAYLSAMGTTFLVGGRHGWFLYYGPTVQSIGIAAGGRNAVHFDFTKGINGFHKEVEGDANGNVLVRTLGGTAGDQLYVLLDCRLYRG